MSSETIARLQERLAALAPQALVIDDESHLHAGHAGAKGGGHYRLQIVSEQFAGKNTLARHRMIYDMADELMRGPIHALSIHAKTPNEL